MRVLLISTYELGHQPLHVASPAASLAAAGHDVRAVDLKLDRLQDDDLHWAQAVAISVPMHTAMQLARPVVADINARFSSLPICLYGLYATAAADRIEGVDRFIAGEYEPALLAWVSGIVAGIPRAATVVEIGRTPFVVPDRTRLPVLDRYAHLEIGGQHRIVGYVEASHGCRHRCRHCPLPVVYDGTFRTVAVDLVVADADQLIQGGAAHITFGDPDFLNGPHHGMRVLRRIHERHPEVTFDVTVKVEHILRHRELLPEMAELGVVFVVSAFETTNETVLEKLDKGHTAADAAEAVSLVRAAGIDIRPSWMPLLPGARSTT
ncbi:MAG: radical SAM protein [Acidimicrobiia bacterium]|nr:radical SAM protein [Acidimicrobiia bacterium]